MHAQHTKRRCLKAWWDWALVKAGKRECFERAAECCLQRRRRACLAAWRGWAASKVGRRRQAEAAGKHRARRQQRLVVLRWRQLTRLRGLSACWYEHRLQREGFLRWRSHTQYKAEKAAKWRRAVRHRYRQLLQLGLGALAALHAQQKQKRSSAEALLQRCQERLMLRALSAWHGPFLQAARHRRAQEAVAEAHYQRRLASAALLAWCGPILTAARAMRQACQQAVALWRANRLHAVLAAWQCFVAAQRAKRARLAKLQDCLAPGRLLRVLLAWRLACRERTAMRGKTELAMRHGMGVLLRAGFCSWSRYYAARTSKRQLWLSALMLCSKQRQRRALLLWRDAAHAAAAVRRVEGVEDNLLGSRRQVQQQQQTPGRLRCTEGSSLAALLNKLGSLKALASQHVQQGSRTLQPSTDLQQHAAAGESTAAASRSHAGGNCWRPPWAAALQSKQEQGQSAAHPSLSGIERAGWHPWAASNSFPRAAASDAGAELANSTVGLAGNTAEGQEGSSLPASRPWNVPRLQRPQPRRPRAGTSTFSQSDQPSGLAAASASFLCRQCPDSSSQCSPQPLTRRLSDAENS